MLATCILTVTVMMDLLWATCTPQCVTMEMSGVCSPGGHHCKKACYYHVGCQRARGTRGKGLVPAPGRVGHLEVRSSKLTM